MNQNHQRAPDEGNSDNIASLYPRLAASSCRRGHKGGMGKEGMGTNHGSALDGLGGGTMEYGNNDNKAEPNE